MLPDTLSLENVFLLLFSCRGLVPLASQQGWRTAERTFGIDPPRCGIGIIIVGAVCTSTLASFPTFLLPNPLAPRLLRRCCCRIHHIIRLFGRTFRTDDRVRGLMMSSVLLHVS